MQTGLRITIPIDDDIIPKSIHPSIRKNGLFHNSRTKTSLLMATLNKNTVSDSESDADVDTYANTNVHNNVIIPHKYMKSKWFIGLGISIITTAIFCIYRYQKNNQRIFFV